jgi:hypothetical protein
MYDWTRRLPAPAAVERILEATGLLAMTAASSPGGAEAGDLLHAVDRIRQVTEDGGTLADAAGALIEDLSSAEVESVRPSLAGPTVRAEPAAKAGGPAPVVSCRPGPLDRHHDVSSATGYARYLSFH